MLTPEMQSAGRRNFLKAMGGVAALATWGSAVALRGPKRGGPVRAAIIGYGRQGRSLHQSASPDVMAVEALCDIRFDPTAPAADGDPVRRYVEWPHLLDAKTVEAVVIATPPASQVEIALAALEAGKHVLCETPMGIAPEHGRRLEAAAARSGRVLAAVSV
jgi:predicted dehydrogenase